MLSLEKISGVRKRVSTLSIASKSMASRSYTNSSFWISRNFSEIPILAALDRQEDSIGMIINNIGSIFLYIFHEIMFIHELIIAIGSGFQNELP